MTAAPFPRKNGHPEADLQRHIVQSLRAVLPPRESVVHACNSEVRGGSHEARRAQAIAQGMGVVPGFADVIVMVAGKVLFLEIKTPVGRASQAQMAFCNFVEGQGHHYALVRSIDDALAALRAAGIPTRIRGFT
jgi:hypothetical protein